MSLKKAKRCFCMIMIFLFAVMISANTVEAKTKTTVTLNKSSVTLYLNGTKTCQLKATVKGSSAKVKWKSSDKNVATVSATGKVTAKKAGKAKITATVNSVSATCQVTVAASQTKYKCIMTSAPEQADRTIGKTVFSWDSEYVSGEGVYGKIYATVNGKKSLVVYEKDLDASIITDGKTIYYSTSEQNAKVYSKTLTGKTSKQLCTVKNVDYSFTLSGYYNNTIYYVKYLDPGYFCKYSLKNKKHTVIHKNTTIAEQNNQYFYLTPYQGAMGPSKLTVYDAKQNKSKLVSKKLHSYRIVGNSLYYLNITKEVDYFSGIYQVTVYKSTLAGKNAKVVAKNVQLKQLIEITSKKMVYLNKNGVKKEIKF